jgi:dihydroorotate dehydrogenase
MYYNLLQQFLFRLDFEFAHRITLKTLRILDDLQINPFYSKVPDHPIKLMGLQFPNPVGLAAGLDRNGDYIDVLSALGFGFMEFGTVTPAPQLGNPKPRVFCYPQEQSLVNRMGFNNKGVAYLVKRLKEKTSLGIVGVNIGQGRETTLSQASQDYLYCYRHVLAYANYVVINLATSPMQDLPIIQQSEFIDNLFKVLKNEQAIYQQLQGKYVPLLIKISPNLHDELLKSLAKIILINKLDGIIAGGATPTYDNIRFTAGGELSGKHLAEQSYSILPKLTNLLGSAMPVIAVGGILHEADAKVRFAAGASLVQLYSGLIFEGPSLIKRIVDSL